MEDEALIEDLLFELDDLGYKQSIQLKDGFLFFEPKSLTLKPTDLFFIDGAYKVGESYLLLVINSPLYDIKGTVQFTSEEYNQLKATNYLKHDLEILNYTMEAEPVVIRRQYDMRKILANEFEEDRYILKQGFPDFPPCPYGHTFKQLGYDTKLEEYVRLSSSIVKKKNIKTVKYN